MTVEKPKKVNAKLNGVPVVQTVCHNCDMVFYTTINGFGTIKHERIEDVLFCPKCGQAIDWSED